MTDMLSLKRWLLFLGCFLLPLIVLVVVSSAQKDVPGVNWQWSEGVAVQLSVRDKYGTLGSYKATFLVVAPDGKQYEVEKDVSNDEWSDTFFPSDFGALEKPGQYKWQCVVDGDVVASGKFEFKTTNTYTDQAKILR